MPSPEEMERFAAEGKMVLRTEDLVKKYGQRTVANHVSINVRQGEIVRRFQFIVGRSMVSGIWLRKLRYSGSCQ